ncbi:hypothetical protein DERP_011022 [Dermatophagoides pteronyssinus]|uniref:Uncharacterized protein n=1 Tax=Dermatophagoides pteronyssinus TaxID=6956 RepID=A0ABQ8JVL6_DERPT|nr:hypothetical protein DERP_011022 [Dermatophagoides pteronyssinus]
MDNLVSTLNVTPPFQIEVVGRPWLGISARCIKNNDKNKYQCDDLSPTLMQARNPKTLVPV